MEREKFGSRLGFLLISAGCAIGLGNVWRFPYICGQYGGAAFLLIYLVFLVIFALPVMIMEFSVGRASRRSVATSFDVLQKPGQKWHIPGKFMALGNYILMMFYTTVGGWMLAYVFKIASGSLSGLNAEQIAGEFSAMTASPFQMIFWMVIVTAASFLVCSLGLQKGVERITKIMMSALFIIMLILCINSLRLEGGMEGLKFYLVPDFSKVVDNGVGNVLYAAMGQSFFTLSTGMGSMAIFGSYISRDRSLTGEGLTVCALDTSVAFMAGLIIFPACFAFGVNPGQGPELVFITLPNVFNNMAFGQLWGTLFFIFMTFAAVSTIIAVFQNIIGITEDLFGWNTKKSVLINGIALIILSLPCALGFNVLSWIEPFGAGSTIQDLEDFIVSNNILPLGSLVYLFFCVTRYGWGWDNFIKEADTGKGAKFPKLFRPYFTYVLPVLILVVFVMGYVQKFVG